MSLFSNPQTINDGVTDRIFNWLRQVPSQIAGIWSESAADPSAASQFKTAHSTENSGRKRHLLQRVENCTLTEVDSDGRTTDDIIVNLTVSHHPNADATDVEKQVTLVRNAAGLSGFVADFMREEL